MKRSDIKKLDSLWAFLIKECAEWTCEYCGIRGVRMEAAHVVGRRHRFTRWGCYVEPKCRAGTGIAVYDACGHCLCHNCHQQYDEHGPLEDKIVNKVIGAGRKESLQLLANQKIFQTFEDVYASLIESVDFRVEFSKKEKKWLRT